jgi:hypothetical protein
MVPPPAPKERLLRVVIFWEDGFPFIDTAPLTKDTLRAAFNPEDDLQFISAISDLRTALDGLPDLFVNPYGSAFPKAIWPAFTAYLRRGGNWVNLGGAPLTRPVRQVSDDRRWTMDHGPDAEQNQDGPRSMVHRPSSNPPAWHVEVPQTAYGKELRINHAFPIDIPPDATLRCPPLDVDLETHFHLFQPTKAWSLQVRFTTTRDFPDEDGSSGPREAVLRPLVVSEVDGRTVAAPIVAIDRLTGEFAGGRWVLACCEGSLPLPSDLIARLCDYATRPRATLDVSPSFACYYPGEMACLNVRAHASQPGDLRISLRVYSKDTQREVYAHIFRTASGVGPALAQTSPFPVRDPGLYIVRASVEVEGRNKPIAHAETGFWVYDKELVTSGKPLTVDRDYFHRDGKAYPVTGTTYMAGDTHRKFLFEPNPAVWDADFAAMAEAGVNMVRTGLWTGWKRAMLDVGAVDEGVLRAFTAFMLTARRYDIPVIFTFFAFLPEAWGGENPYLDPQAVVAQSAFVAAFARRFAHVDDLLWDFINEPSFSSHAQIWKTRPNYDRFERAAWAEWLVAQGVSEDEWRERWRLTPNDPLDLPVLEDFEDRYIFQGTHPLRVMDYRRFAQDKFREWTEKMAQVIRENGNPHQLVTVGQDEGGARDRPNPHFYGPAVDFTSNHSWWQNDDLLWDSVMTKTPDKPNLIEETGIMFVEGVDGRAWRTPEECRNLLERKMALAFAGGCAGFIQWLWNTNVYMDSDNEVGIGFLRADGSEKPELKAFCGVARFFRENAHRMVGRKLEEAVIVIPHSNMFSVRDLADRATRRAVRVLEYDLGIPCRTVSEYRAEEVGDAKLIVLPSPRVLTESCWQTLLQRVEAGATLLVTGYIEADEYWRPVERLKQFGLETTVVPVERSEFVSMEGGTWTSHLTFAGDSVQKMDKANVNGAHPAEVQVTRHGRGQFFYVPVPMELCHNESMEYDVVEKVVMLAGFKCADNDGLLERRVEFDDFAFSILVNESPLTLSGDSRCWQVSYGLNIPAGRIALAFVDRATGEVVSKYEV